MGLEKPGDMGLGGHGDMGLGGHGDMGLGGARGQGEAGRPSRGGHGKWWGRVRGLCSKKKVPTGFGVLGFLRHPWELVWGRRWIHWGIGCPGTPCHETRVPRLWQSSHLLGVPGQLSLLTHPHPPLPAGCRRTGSVTGPRPRVMRASVLRRDRTLTPNPEA